MRHYKFHAILLMFLGLTACVSTSLTDQRLNDVIAARSAEERVRDAARHPVETLQFFQVEPGMTVAEALPGKGWYTRVLAEYLGTEGTLYGVNYSDDMWPLFSFATPEMVAESIALSPAFAATVGGYTDNGIAAEGFTFASVPEQAVGTVDRVLMIRALHNLNHYEQQAGMRSEALAAAHLMLKPDGLLGVVQHRAPESADDHWADGSRGYLKQSAVIEMIEAAGFELVGASEINANPADQPGAEDFVWRLPPSYITSAENPELKARMTAIGESDRMTLLFRRR